MGARARTRCWFKLERAVSWPASTADRPNSSLARPLSTATVRRRNEQGREVERVRPAGAVAGSAAVCRYFVRGDVCGEAEGGGLISATETVTWSPDLIP